MAVRLLKGICGVRFFTEARNIARAKHLQHAPRSLKVRRGLFYGAVLASAAYWQLWPLLLKYWIVSVMTTLAFILYVRSLAEHHGGAMIWDGDMLRGSRHLDATWWEKFLLAPHNVHYHVDHHLYPPCRTTTSRGCMRCCSPSLSMWRGRISRTGTVPASDGSVCGRRFSPSFAMAIRVAPGRSCYPC